MDDEQIKHMVNRFLSWKLPDNFRPDAGISFKAEFNEHTSRPTRHEPSGTNLFDATQAEAMIRHIVEGVDPEWEGELTAEEQAMIDRAWEIHKAASPPDAATSDESKPEVDRNSDTPATDDHVVGATDMVAIDVSALVERLRRNARWRDERFHCIADPTMLAEAADALAALRAEVERLNYKRNFWRSMWENVTFRDSQAEATIAELRALLETDQAAMAEMFRYFDGGETRGSYDGKPERDGLRKAWYATRAALAKIREQG